MSGDQWYEVVGIAETTQMDGTELVTKQKIFIRKQNTASVDDIGCITFYKLASDISSDWCNAIQYKFEYCDLQDNQLTHVPKKRLKLTWNRDHRDFPTTISNDVFEFSKDRYRLNMDLFNVLPGYIDKRVVYVFTGESAVGKTYLTRHLRRDLKVYETDSSIDLPESLYADVIVLGNRSKFTLEQIKDRIVQPARVVICSMTKMI